MESAEPKSKKAGWFNSDWIILGCIAFVILFFVLFSSCSVSDGAGACFSVSVFGKLELRNIDRVVISTADKEVEITTPELIDQLVSETRVATHTNCCNDSPRRIELYRDNELVRSMEWSRCCDTVRVYEPDLTHWLIDPPGDDTEAGYVYLSDELIEQLNAIFE